MLLLYPIMYLILPWHGTTCYCSILSCILSYPGLVPHVTTVSYHVSYLTLACYHMLLLYLILYPILPWPGTTCYCCIPSCILSYPGLVPHVTAVSYHVSYLTLAWYHMLLLYL